MDESMLEEPLQEYEADLDSGREPCFYRLPCGHIFEVGAIDKWMANAMSEQKDGESRKIQFPSCPLCRTVIYRAPRYGTILNKVLNDIELIKYEKQVKIIREFDKLKSELTRLSTEAQQRRIEEIQAALRLVLPNSSHWFRCSNGHYYAIGECGGAMEESRCPDCGELIGGTQHTLAASSRPAFELGSRGSQWMPNLQPDNEPVHLARPPTPPPEPIPPPPVRSVFPFALPQDGDEVQQDGEDEPVQVGAASSLSSASSSSSSPSSSSLSASRAAAAAAALARDYERRRLLAMQDVEYEEALLIDEANFEAERRRQG